MASDRAQSTAVFLARVGLALGMAAAAPPAHFGRVLAQSPPPAPEARTAEALDELLSQFETDGRRGAAWLELAVADLSAEAVPAVFAVLDRGSYVRRVEGQRPGPAALQPAQRQALLRALARVPHRAVVQHLRALLEADPDLGLRRLAYEVLAQAGQREDLDLLLLFSGARQRDELVDPDLRGGLSDALAAIVARDPSTVWSVRERYASAPLALQATLVTALAESRTDEALLVLAGLLGHEPASDGVVLAALDRMTAGMRSSDDEYVASAVRSYADHEDPQHARTAIRILGRLRDAESVPGLVEKLAVADPATRHLSWQALCSITGLSLREEPVLWERWLEDETAWRTRRAAAVMAELEARDPGAVAAAVRTLSEHRLWHHELAEALLVVLARPEPELRRLACAALARLGSRRVAPELEALENDQDASVRAAARKALESLVPERERTPVPAGL